MTEVVYNECYGGFSISVNMAKYIAERTQDEILKKELIAGIEYATSHPAFRQDSVHTFPQISRHDPLLIEAVKKFPDETHKECRNLKIMDIGNAPEYKIDEYDGYESVVTRCTENGWIKV